MTLAVRAAVIAIFQRFIPTKKRGCTKGGEALLETMSEPDIATAIALSSQTAPWYALWTHSNCEQLVHDQLVQKGLYAFLPKVEAWSSRRGVRHVVPAPMFPGYLFLRHAMDKRAYLEVRKTRGLVSVLGERWDRLTPIPDAEIEPIEKVTAAGCRVLPFPYLKEGQRVRIAGGPLAGVEGILLDARPKQGLIVLSVHLLQRSVAVTVDGTEVVPA